MFPFLFESTSLRVQSYGFFIALGYFAALLFSRRRARKAGISPASFSDLCFIALFSGVVGARALFVLTNFSHFRERPMEIFNFWSGGLVFFGGFLVALPLCLLYIRRKRLPALKTLDLLAPPLALGHAIGRIGCFAAGCCHGAYCEYPWGLQFHSTLVEPALRGLPLHPTQLYESMGLFILTGILLLREKRKTFVGETAGLYLMAYGALRFFIEIFRGDSIRGSIPELGLSTSQTIAVLIFFGGLLLLASRFRRVRRNH